MSRKVRHLLIYIFVGIGSAMIGWLFARSVIGKQLELRTYDYRFRLKQMSPDPVPAPITILSIDEHSLDKISAPLMLWHGYFADILNYLVMSDAAVVGIDFAFPRLEKEDKPQLALRQVLLNSSGSPTAIVLAYAARNKPEEPLETTLLTAVLSGHTLGFANLTVDSDDFIRRQVLQQSDTPNMLPASFPLAVASAYAKRKGMFLRSPEPGESILINFRLEEEFPRISFYDAWTAASSRNMDFFREKFRDRIVIIGRIGARGGEDLHSTPLYYLPQPGPEGFRTPGTLIHANTIATLLANDAIVELAAPVQTMIVLLVASLITFLWSYTRLFTSVTLTLLLLSTFVLIVIVGFFHNVWIWAVGPIGSGASALAMTLAADYFLEGKEKKRMRALFGRYVSDTVIGQLLERPGDVVLEGERRSVAVMFADIKGFTTLSESLEAEKVVKLLNVYFGEILGVIQAHRGTVNSLMGDGLMAIFGAPIRDDDAGFHAVQAATDMMNALERVNRLLATDGFPPIQIGIGINSGAAVIGNMGSPRKMEYTATGDVVNTASRIEGQTRKFTDADILISQPTYESLKNRIPAEFVANVEVKGRKESVALYRVNWKGTKVGSGLFSPP